MTSLAVLGIGNGNVQAVPVDDAARMDAKQLDQLLEKCIEPTDERKRTPVYQVVVIMGSTEQGAIDPLVDVIALRDKYEQKGLSFVVHCDAAWGGYFASMIREPSKDFEGAPPASFVPVDTLSEYVTDQVLAFGRSDSITIDPHK
jgi:glutamate/tyrosine decarboxylase-like PLP-dependent enzyme